MTLPLLRLLGHPDEVLQDGPRVQNALSINELKHLRLPLAVLASQSHRWDNGIWIAAGIGSREESWSRTYRDKLNL